MPLQISISDAYDGGNIEFVSTDFHPSSNESSIFAKAVVTVRIKPDVYTELEKINHMQYFSFRSTISGLEAENEEQQQQQQQLSSVQVTYVIENASKVSYPVAWDGTTVCYSPDVEDSESWVRNHTTRYNDGTLTWIHRHTTNGSMYFSYFPPYSYGRHLQLVSKCAAAAAAARNNNNNKNAHVMSLGQTLQGREIDCIRVGNGEHTCWIIHRQHPGETMAEHYAEGLLTRLLGLDNNDENDTTNDDDDEQVQRVLELYTFYIVPCMCLDGAVLGHLRTNSVGANLNREWASKGDYVAPSKERSPEVLAVLTKMDETGCDMFLDVHGDEELPFNFISGAELVPTWGKRLESLHGAFVAAYHRTNSDMQQFIGYPPPDSAELCAKYLNVATNQVATRFNCLALTLEMPFKDCDTNPDPDRGWSPARSRKLGASVLGPLEYIHPFLRAEGDFWTQLAPEDKYICPTDEYQDFKPLSHRMYSDVRAILK